jgi:hypothetical protein
MTLRPAALLLLALLALPGRLAAQQRLVVPEGAAVVVPARGAAPLPRPVAAPQLRAGRIAPLPSAADPAAPSPALGLVPLAAAAVLAATLSGGGGGGVSAPVRTR